jgi:predicted ArsR family transcriptional regulator
MKSTKDQILSYLKRSGGSTVDDIAGEFGLARMTVRQHLTGLERDGLVDTREERGRSGRPHMVFSLSDHGEELFPKRYDRLADLVLKEATRLTAEEITGLDEDGRKRLLLQKMVERVYHEHEAKLDGKALPERVAMVADILREEGGLADWAQDGRSYEIVDYNCVYRRVVDSHPGVCDWHVSLLSRLLGTKVECSQFMSRGAESCRFVVREAEIELEPIGVERKVDVGAE